MAKKKTSPKKVLKQSANEAETADSTQTQHPLFLASPIAGEAILRTIFLLESDVKRTPDAPTDLNDPEVEIEVRVEQLTINHPGDDDTFSIVPVLAMIAKRSADDEKREFLWIQATYVSIYGFHQPEELTEENYSAFARSSGLLGIWPYFREYVNGVCSRMAIQPVILPLYRV